MMGCNNLGYLYLKGEGVQQSFAKAKIFYEKACSGDIGIGCNNLGYLYAFGQGVEQDYKQAKQQYEKRRYYHKYGKKDLSFVWWEGIKRLENI